MHMGSPASIGRVSRRWRGSRAHHGRQPALSKCARCQDKGSSQLACRYAYEAHGPDTPAKLKQGHCRDGKGVAGAASTLNCAFAQASRLSQPPHLCCTQPTHKHAWTCDATAFWHMLAVARRVMAMRTSLAASGALSCPPTSALYSRPAPQAACCCAHASVAVLSTSPASSQSTGTSSSFSRLRSCSGVGAHLTFSTRTTRSRQLAATASSEGATAQLPELLYGQVRHAARPCPSLSKFLQANRLVSGSRGGSAQSHPDAPMTLVSLPSHATGH